VSYNASAFKNLTTQKYPSKISKQKYFNTLMNTLAYYQQRQVWLSVSVVVNSAFTDLAPGLDLRRLNFLTTQQIANVVRFFKQNFLFCFQKTLAYYIQCQSGTMSVCLTTFCLTMFRLTTFRLILLGP
jgi:hypothetical protein